MPCSFYIKNNVYKNCNILSPLSVDNVECINYISSYIYVYKIYKNTYLNMS